VDTTNLLPVLGILALAVVIVILLLRVMRARHVADAGRVAAPRAEAEKPPHATLTNEEQEYLDSSHISGPIVPGGRDALETWQQNKRK